MNRFVIRVILAAVALAAIAYAALTMWTASLPRAETIRLRATATILVDGIERTGSAVQEFQIQWIYEPQIGRTGAWRIVARGEAVKVDVPGEEPIYVLMSASNGGGNYGAIVEAQCTIRGQGPEVQKASFVGMDRCDLRRFPQAIRFDETGDHDTAIAVYTSGENRNGYEFVRMDFERTGDPVTKGSIPDEIWANDRKYISVPYGPLTSIVGDLSFESEKFW